MSDMFRKLVRPALFRLDAETAHELGVAALQLGLGTRFARERVARRFISHDFGEIERFGLKFGSPLGMAAGFDKNGVVVDQIAALGFGFVEVGTVTLEPQTGNGKPRLFRLPLDQALINRLGFNNEGATKVADRLATIDRKCIVGVNIGKNKDVPIEEATENYLQCLDLIHHAADYIVVNISSPNTPNLRQLQQVDYLAELVSALQNRNQYLGEIGGSNTKPLLIKIAPDLSEPDIELIVDTCLRLQVSGIIATNTTISRDGLLSKRVDDLGPGGLSGRPLARRSTEVIRAVYRQSNGKLPIIGVGGVFTAEDAFEKIAAGACLVQAYTGFIYKGPAFAREINGGLAAILKERGFSHIDQAVGSGP